MEVFKKLNAEAWFLLLMVTGYSVVSAFAIPLNIKESRIFSVPFRVLIFIFSLIIIYRNFTDKKLLNISVLATILFWVFYFVKSYMSFTQDDYGELFKLQFYEIYIRIIVIALVPSFALLFINYKKVDLQAVSRIFFLTLFVLLVFNLIFGLVTPHGYSLLYIFTMYYISYGHLGTTLALLAAFYLLFRAADFNKIILYAAFVLGLVTIIIAGARNPFLALLVGLFYLFLVKRNFKILLGFGVFMLLSVFLIYMLGQLQNPSLIFVNRTYLWIFEGDTSERGPLFRRSLEIFSENKWLGGRTHYEDGSYPHNIFLELLMATGILGFILYLLKFIPVLKKPGIFFFSIGNIFTVLFFSLFLQYFILVSTSFTLYSVPEFLYFSSIIIGISLNPVHEENESDDGSRNPSGNY